ASLSARGNRNGPTCSRGSGASSNPGPWSWSLIDGDSFRNAGGPVAQGVQANESLLGLVKALQLVVGVEQLFHHAGVLRAERLRLFQVVQGRCVAARVGFALGEA